LQNSDICRLARAYSRLGTIHATSLELGTNKTRFLGPGIEYRDFREYQPEDDYRYIDWNISLRSIDPYTNDIKLYTKLFTVEHKSKVLIALDISRSMAIGEKISSMIYTSSLILETAHRLEDSIILMLLGAKASIYHGLRGREALELIVNTICRGALAETSRLDEVVKLLRRGRMRIDSIILFIDYGHSIESFIQLINTARTLETPLTTIFTVYRWEVEKPLDRGSIVFFDIETGEEIYGDIDNIYRDIKNHINRVKSYIEASAIPYIEIQSLRDAIDKKVKVLYLYIALRTRRKNF